MADSNDDIKLGLKSSVLTLGEKTKGVVSISYSITSFSLALGAHIAGVSWIFWPIWAIGFLANCI